MSRVTYDSSKAAPFIRPEELQLMEKLTADARETLVSKSGAGNDFLGWIDLPVNYDKAEFDRILKGIPDPVTAMPDGEKLETESAPQPEAEKAEPLFDLFGFLRPKKEEQTGTEAGPAEPETSDTDKELYWYQKMAEEGLITWDQYEQKKRELQDR